MRPVTQCPAFFIALATLISAGCEVRQYEVSTRLDTDGSIHREIYQPLDNTLPPEAIEEPDASDATSQPASRPAITLAAKWRDKWANIQQVEAPAEAQFPRPLPLNSENGDLYFKAAGDFDSIDNVPGSYYRPAAPLPDRASENLLGHSLDDYHLFAIEHWEEEITETVSLAEYISAADDFSRLLLPPLKKALDDLYGKEYQLKDLHTWTHRQLAEAFRQYCLWFYQYHPANVDELGDRGIRDLKAVFALMDVNLPLTEKGDVDLDTWPDALDESAVEIVRHTIRFKDGHELNEDEAGYLWDQIQADLGIQLSGEQDESGDDPSHVQRTGLRRKETDPSREGRRAATFLVARARGSEGRYRVTQEDAQPQNGQDSPRLFQAWEKQFETMHGEDGQMQLFRIDAQMGGAHHNSPLNRFRQLFGGEPILPGLSRFTYKLETSGPIIETNGVRLADNRVRWKFTSRDLFPDGISMAARAVRWNRSAERKLFGGIVLKDIGTVVKLVDAIELEDPVEQALDDAVKQGSLSPVEDLLKDEDEKVRGAAQMILQLKQNVSGKKKTTK